MFEEDPKDNIGYRLMIKLADQIIKEKGMTKEVKDILATAQDLIDRHDTERKLREEYEALPIEGQDEWTEVGQVGVDAGMVWMGDPCYILALPHCRQNKIEEKKKEPSWDAVKSLYENVKELPSTLGDSWHGFCDKMNGDADEPIMGYGSEETIKWYKEQIKKGFRKGQRAVQFNYELGHPGLGVCMDSGYGDGTYPVYVKRNHEGRITEAKIVFIDEEDEKEEEDE